MSGLRITNATLGTVTLHDPATGVFGQIAYVPSSTEPLTNQQSSALDDGGETPIVTLGNISESATVYIDSGNTSALLTVVRTINLLLDHARTYQRIKAGSPTYLEWRPTDSGSWFRSEILYGHCTGREDTLDGWMLPSGRVVITLNVTRRFYWEGDLTYVNMTNQHGTNVSTITINNTNDASYDNFVEVVSTISGDLPSPIRLEYTNTFAGSNTANLLIGHSAIATPAASDMILETSAMAAVNFSPSTVVGTFSGGSYRNWSVTVTAETSLGYWNIPTALLQSGLGMWYRLIARIPTGSTAYQIRCNVKINNLSPLFNGAWVTPSPQTGLVDLGAVQLPPYLRGINAGMAALTLGLDVRATGASTYSVPIDCVQFLPTESWRMIRQNGFGLAQNSRIIDDQIAETTYTDNGSGSSIIGNYVPDGSKIFLRPSRTNRIYFLATNISNTSEVNRSASVRIAYRPRYRMV